MDLRSKIRNKPRQRNEKDKKQCEKLGPTLLTQLHNEEQEAKRDKIVFGSPTISLNSEKSTILLRYEASEGLMPNEEELISISQLDPIPYRCGASKTKKKPDVPFEAAPLKVKSWLNQSNFMDYDDEIDSRIENVGSSCKFHNKTSRKLVYDARNTVIPTEDGDDDPYEFVASQRAEQVTKKRKTMVGVRRSYSKRNIAQYFLQKARDNVQKPTTSGTETSFANQKSSFNVSRTDKIVSNLETAVSRPSKTSKGVVSCEKSDSRLPDTGKLVVSCDKFDSILKENSKRFLNCEESDGSPSESNKRASSCEKSRSNTSESSKRIVSCEKSGSRRNENSKMVVSCEKTGSRPPESNKKASSCEKSDSRPTESNKRFGGWEKSDCSSSESNKSGSSCDKPSSGPSNSTKTVPPCVKPIAKPFEGRKEVTTSGQSASKLLKNNKTSQKSSLKPSDICKKISSDKKFSSKKSLIEKTVFTDTQPSDFFDGDYDTFDRLLAERPTRRFRTVSKSIPSDTETCEVNVFPVRSQSVDLGQRRSIRRNLKRNEDGGRWKRNVTKKRKWQSEDDGLEEFQDRDFDGHGILIRRYNLRKRRNVTDIEIENEKGTSKQNNLQMEITKENKKNSEEEIDSSSDDCDSSSDDCDSSSHISQNTTISYDTNIRDEDNVIDLDDEISSENVLKMDEHDYELLEKLKQKFLVDSATTKDESKPENVIVTRDESIECSDLSSDESEKEIPLKSPHSVADCDGEALNAVATTETSDRAPPREEPLKQTVSCQTEPFRGNCVECPQCRATFDYENGVGKLKDGQPNYEKVFSLLQSCNRQSLAATVGILNSMIDLMPSMDSNITPQVLNSTAGNELIEINVAERCATPVMTNVVKHCEMSVATTIDVAECCATPVTATDPVAKRCEMSVAMTIDVAKQCDMFATGNVVANRWEMLQASLSDATKCSATKVAAMNDITKRSEMSVVVMNDVGKSGEMSVAATNNVAKCCDMSVVAANDVAKHGVMTVAATNNIVKPGAISSTTNDVMERFDMSVAATNDVAKHGVMLESTTKDVTENCKMTSNASIDVCSLLSDDDSFSALFESEPSESLFSMDIGDCDVEIASLEGGQLDCEHSSRSSEEIELLKQVIDVSNKVPFHSKENDSQCVTQKPKVKKTVRGLAMRPSNYDLNPDDDDVSCQTLPSYLCRQQSLCGNTVPRKPLVINTAQIQTPKKSREMLDIEIESSKKQNLDLEHLAMTKTSSKSVADTMTNFTLVNSIDNDENQWNEKDSQWAPFSAFSTETEFLNTQDRDKLLREIEAERENLVQLEKQVKIKEKEQKGSNLEANRHRT